MEPFILALDQGTTSSRALIIDRKGNIRSQAQKEFTQVFPKPGWVEHDPLEIWSSQVAVAAEAMSKLGIDGSNLAGIGITNQRETTIVWDKRTGEPFYNAIVWQDRRTSEYCDELKAAKHDLAIRKKTGLIVDAYFSGTKVKWILENVVGARELAEQGHLAFGTVDTWLVWKFTGGKTHITDVSNASRTMLFNIHKLTWDDELLSLFDIPKSILPTVASSSEVYGHTSPSVFAMQVPISGIAGDQQAALFGQMCVNDGMVKSTYGTGCFILANTGSTPFESKNQMLTTIAWKIGNQTTYALEGSVFVAGAVVQWLRDGLGIINSSSEIEALAQQVPDSGDVFFVPSFTGLGAPYWDQYARGAIVGMTRGTTKAHIARAALEAIGFQTAEVIKAMELDSGIPISEIRVDGGASANNLLMQFQSNILNKPVIRPQFVETTALGAAYLAGLATGFWSNIEEIKQQWQPQRRFEPQMDVKTSERLLNRWHEAVIRSKGWAVREY